MHKHGVSPPVSIITVTSDKSLFCTLVAQTYCLVLGNAVYQRDDKDFSLSTEWVFVSVGLCSPGSPLLNGLVSIEFGEVKIIVGKTLWSYTMLRIGSS